MQFFSAFLFVLLCVTVRLFTGLLRKLAGKTQLGRTKGKGQGKIHPITGREGPQRE